MTERRMDFLKRWTALGMLVACFGICVWLFRAYMDGKFDSVETLRQYIAGFGLMAPCILMVIQMAQVVFPILPGALGCAAGAVLFGMMGGFWCNYIGISVGTMAAFLLARKYGSGLVAKMFPGKKYEKLSSWAAESRFYTAVLFLVMLLPLFPDDYFCYFTGVTKMSSRKFAAIIVLGKPWCILAYSIIFSVAAAGR